jgi:hydroxymethylglutaryl-CoA lyase
MLKLPKSVDIVEVGPRDGLQSFARWIDTDIKVAMIDRLTAAGFALIEATSFARPSAVPNLKDAETVLARIQRRPSTRIRALVPNAKGAERAVGCGMVDELLGLITVSETYLAHNQNMTKAKAIEEGISAFEIASSGGLGFTMALGMALWCPYEGRIPEENVLAMLDRFCDAGIKRFYFAGSVGMEDPQHVHDLFRMALERHSSIELGYHVHNVPGFGVANVLAALDAGASFLEGSICGVGGGIAMPTNMGMVGNLPTEDIVHLLNASGIDTGLDTAQVLACAQDIGQLLEIEPLSHLTRSGTRESMLGERLTQTS